LFRYVTFWGGKKPPFNHVRSVSHDGILNQDIVAKKCEKSRPAETLTDRRRGEWGTERGDGRHRELSNPLDFCRRLPRRTIHHGPDSLISQRTSRPAARTLHVRAVRIRRWTATGILGHLVFFPSRTLNNVIDLSDENVVVATGTVLRATT